VAAGDVGYFLLHDLRMQCVHPYLYDVAQVTQVITALLYHNALGLPHVVYSVVGRCELNCVDTRVEIAWLQRLKLKLDEQLCLII
jgi:hypothetical protein